MQFVRSTAIFSPIHVTSKVIQESVLEITLFSIFNDFFFREHGMLAAAAYAADVKLLGNLMRYTCLHAQRNRSIVVEVV